ncbi:MAG TPA: hypothetical protein VMB81_09260 [Candidatus Sulfotelmatobacter sp.]|nr:hypothetical protein [Candidatus Sulfotelmatobacter sp.]
MTADVIKEDLRRLLQRADERIARAERQLAGKDDRAKVAAAGELEFLRHQRSALEARLAKLDVAAHGASTGGWLREELMILEQRLEEWMMRH